MYKGGRMLVRANDHLVVVLVSIVLLEPILEPRHPSANGNTPTGHAFDLIGISPPPGSLRGALIGCDGSRLFNRFNARPVTGRKYR